MMYNNNTTRRDVRKAQKLIIFYAKLPPQIETESE